MVQNRIVMEITHQKDRQRGEFNPMRLCTDIGGQGHLTDVIGQFAHHPAKAMDQNRHLFEIELEIRQRNLPLFERPVIALGARNGVQFGLGHFLKFFQ